MRALLPTWHPLSCPVDVSGVHGVFSFLDFISIEVPSPGGRALHKLRPQTFPRNDISMNRLRYGERAVALLEAGKGLLVLLAGLGLLAFLHRDVQHLAEALVGRLHLNAAKGYPRIFVDAASQVTDARLWLLAGLAAGYSAMRLTEAYGLWRGRRWAEWFSVGSGAIYVPVEIYELLAGFRWIKLAALMVNLGIVAYMVWAIRTTNREHRGCQAAETSP